MKPKTAALEQGGKCTAPSSIDVCSETKHKEVIFTQTGLAIEYTCTILESCWSFELALVMAVELLGIFQVGRIKENTIE